MGVNAFISVALCTKQAFQTSQPFDQHAHYNEAKCKHATQTTVTTHKMQVSQTNHGDTYSTLERTHPDAPPKLPFL